MTRHDPTLDQATGATLGDVLVWARETGEKSDAIYELEKIPARMGMTDADIGMIPADLGHFEKVIAPAPYGAVSNAGDLKTARQRGNSRVRALLKRFFHAGDRSDADVRASYDALIAQVEALEGFPARGAVFPTGRHKSLFALRARCRVALRDLNQREIDRIWDDATSEKRKSLRKAIGLLNRLIAMGNSHPAFGDLLPPVGFVVPQGTDRARRIPWASLPEGLRIESEAVFRRTIATPADLAEEIRARLAAGEDPEVVDREITDRASRRRRRVKNSSTASEGYRAAVTWLVRAAEERGHDLDEISLGLLLDHTVLSAACDDQIVRSEAAVTLKDPRKSQTLRNRLVDLQTIATHGLRDARAVATIRLMKSAYAAFIVEPGADMVEEIDHTCRMLRDHPDLAARFVRAPETLAADAEARIAQARASGNARAELRGLRLHACAAAYALQLSRPLRPENLIRLRHAGVSGANANLCWIRQKTHAELRFAKGEIKNEIAIKVSVLEGDAEILWQWQKVRRARFVELSGIVDTPYLFPGAAVPRHVKDALSLPDGCLAPSTFGEFWSLGEDVLGLGLTPHQCRHAVATLILAMEPGNFALAASVLGDTEETVRKHYGCDNGQAAAAAVRQALLSRHPKLFKRLKGKLNNARTKDDC